MPGRATLADIARLSGVSPSTVSLVLHGRPGISEETRQRVLQAAAAQGYRVRVQRGRRRRTPGQIGLILRVHEGESMHANPFYSPVLAGIELACREHAIGLLYTTVLVGEDNRALETPRLLLEQRAGGLLVVGMFLDERLVDVLRASSPVVLVDAYATEPLDAVVTQNYEGAYRAVSYLVHKGHRHIAFVGGHLQAFPSLQERRRGYVQALQDHGIEDRYFADCIVFRGGEVEEATSQFLKQHPQVTALFGCNDITAIRAMRAAQALSYSIPDDLSVIGFDDIEAAHLVMPGLTTMHVDKPSMGRMGVRMLLHRLRSPEMPPITSALATRLVERQSVRDIREAIAGS